MYVNNWKCQWNLIFNEPFCYSYIAKSLLDKGRLVICQEKKWKDKHIGKYTATKFDCCEKKFYFSVLLSNETQWKFLHITSGLSLPYLKRTRAGDPDFSFTDIWVQWSNVQGFESYLRAICQHKFPFKRLLTLQTSTTLSAMRALVLALILAVVGEWWCLCKTLLFYKYVQK